MCSILDAADQAHARHSAARAELLEAVQEVAATEAWRGHGAGDLPSFLCARWQISRATARGLVREAEQLKGRPALKSALAAGSISEDQCKALIVLCRENSGDDEVSLENLAFWTITELEREARRQTARELERKDGGTYLRMEHTSDERFMRGVFQLHPEDGAAVLSAIDARIPNGTGLRDWDKASALALVEMAKGSVVTASSDRPTVLLSVGETSNDVARLSSGGFVGAETARRLSCDARIQPVHRDANGRITGFGKTSRNISPAMRRIVEERDNQMCTFQGCGREFYLECHHIIPVERGGPTVLHNLLLVCWKHHKLVHDDGWSLQGPPGPHITWIRPDGTPFEPRVRVTLDTS